MFIASGMLQGVLDATSEDPALQWPIERTDCLDLLHTISFMFRALDQSVDFVG